MISNLTIGGIVFAAFTCTMLAVLSAVLSYKYRGNAGGALMTFVFGFAAVMLANSVSNVLFALTGLGNLMTANDMLVVISGFLAYALVFALVDFGIRYYLIYYMDKTGIGKHKSFSLSGGYVLGSTMPYVFSLLMRIMYAIAIRDGRFLDESQKGTENYQAALELQESMINMPWNQFYTFALQFIAICALNVVLVMYMTRGWLENEKKKTSIIAFSATFAFEAVRQIINALGSGDNAVLSAEAAFYVCGAFYICATAACYYFFKKVMTNFPNGREKFIKSVAQIREENAAKKKRVEWQQVNMLNAKNNSENEENEETEEFEAEAEVNEEKENAEN